MCSLHREQIKGHDTDPKPQRWYVKFGPKRGKAGGGGGGKLLRCEKDTGGGGVVPPSRQSALSRLLLWSIMHHCWKAWLPLVRAV